MIAGEELQLILWLTPSSMSSLMIHRPLTTRFLKSGRAILTLTQPLGQVFKSACGRHFFLVKAFKRLRDFQRNFALNKFPLK